MKQEHILVLSWALILSALMSVVNATDAHQLPQKNHQSSALDDDPFFQSDDVFEQVRSMQEAMDRLMQKQFKQINNNPTGFVGAKNTLNSAQHVQIKEVNNELTYTIQKPESGDSKIDVSVKDGLLIVNTHFMQKTSHNEHGSKSYSYSQSNATQSFKLPSGYDPNSMDLKTKDSNLIVTFKKQPVPSFLKI